MVVAGFNVTVNNRMTGNLGIYQAGQLIAVAFQEMFLFN